MGPQALLILEAAIKYGPLVGNAIRGLFEKGDPTKEEWDALFKLMQEQRGKTYFDMVPASNLQDG